jgi:hypothetical protein
MKEKKRKNGNYIEAESAGGGRRKRKKNERSPFRIWVQK